MFSKDSKLEKFKDAETVIGASIKVKGNFQGQGNIIIEGFLEGSLKTEANVFIGPQAKVLANIEAQDAIVTGEVRGNVKAKKYLAIGATAKIFGDLQYGEVSIERGAIINGQLSLAGDDKRVDKVKTDDREAAAK